MSMADNIMPNSVGTITKPCLTLCHLKWFRELSITLTAKPHSIMKLLHRTIAMKLCGQPNLAMIFQSPSERRSSEQYCKCKTYNQEYKLKPTVVPFSQPTNTPFRPFLGSVRAATKLYMNYKCAHRLFDNWIFMSCERVVDPRLNGIRVS